MKLHGHDIEVGDKVWHVIHGEGELLKFDSGPVPFLVKCKRSYLWCQEKELFWQPFDIPAHAYQKPKKLVEQGIVVYKRKDGSVNCYLYKLTKKQFEESNPNLTFIRFVEETVEMVEE